MATGISNGINLIMGAAQGIYDITTSIRDEQSARRLRILARKIMIAVGEMREISMGVGVDNKTV